MLGYTFAIIVSSSVKWRQQSRLSRGQHDAQEVTQNIIAPGDRKLSISITWSFPGGSVLKNSPTSAGDMGSIPDPGNSDKPQSHEARAPQLLSLRSGVQEPQQLKPKCPGASALQPEKPAQREACAPQLESSPSSPPEKSLCHNEAPV